MGQTGSVMSTTKISVRYKVLTRKKEVFLTDGGQLERENNNSS